MKLNGTFHLRQIGDDVVAVPTGETALHFNGMVMLNTVSRLLWERLEQGCTAADLTAAVMAEFEVTEAEATADIADFLSALRSAGFLEE